MIDTQPSATTYVSHVVAVPSELAQQVFDACRADRQYRSSDPARWLVPASARAVLHVVGAGVGDVGSGDLLLRRCPAVLKVGRRRHRVELELSQWSAAESELGVRFRQRRVSDRAHEAAMQVLDVLAAELELRGLLAHHPAHVTGAERLEVIGSAWL